MSNLVAEAVREIGPGNGSECEVSDRPKRRSFTAGYKLGVLKEADACSEPGEVGALLRREGLWSSHLTSWRRERDCGALVALGKKRGRKATPVDPSAEEVVRLRKENEKLKKRLEQAEMIIDIQKKVASMLGIPLRSPESGGSDS